MTLWQQIVALRREFAESAKLVHTERWQGVDISKKPEMATYELQHVHFSASLAAREDLDYFRRQIAPALPWADDHFEERVCGEPINPGIQWAKWPFGNSAKSFLNAAGKFNHNYMERYWPKWAGKINGPTGTPEDYEVGLHELNVLSPNHGIYHAYGDLRDVVKQLAQEPLTRQAMLPVFFPEDTGAIHGGRVPCSIAYQFIIRNGKLDVVYWLRSCDFKRHFRDDVYLTVRLALWVLQQARKQNPSLEEVKMGKLVMLITSLHVFKNDIDEFRVRL